ncbi:interleukin-18 receptor 1-like isoform X1 [Rhinatrema bivittatum]|uniref:interleukin-18 receptor 1-like isoform X1 n=1 Tax=Rhinatrema bivittatum TaxID=194408 RepID=UPI001125E673|nr:interleukin-18 receptor 1-like isoform X1 [Rhinatrema bivittatum]XP_029460689.1 interleukin-18 receptor 1-like isoform X1 [Rhinatrema bivittatum]
MDCQGLLILIFMLLNGPTTGNASHVTCALENEPLQLACPKLTSADPQTGFAIVWYKRNESNELVKLAPEATVRITFTFSSLHFWPAHMNDTGEYVCVQENGTHSARSSKLSLLVNRKNEDCFSTNCTYEKLGIIKKSFTMRCGVIWNYEENGIKTGMPKWYKDCKFLKEDKMFHFNELEATHYGYYTCVVPLSHAGREYNISSTTYLMLEDSPEIAKPQIMGNDIIHHVEVELGKKVRLNCTAFVGYSNSSRYAIYWFRKVNSSDNEGDFFEQCNYSSMQIMPCENTSKKWEQGKMYITNELQIENVKEEDLQYKYICKLSNTVQNENRTHILTKKEKTADIPKHAFTAGMMIAVLFSAITVAVIVVCLIFRVDLILLYRDLTGKDETLADGKEYDAYISYLNEYMLASEEEREFVLQTLPSILENHFGYKLCIFERDVTPGGAIIDDIHSFIEKSRRLIIILTRNYMSDKAMYELESGLHKALVEKKIQVILIEHKPLRDFKFMPESLYLLKSKRTVKWKAKKSLPPNSRFWKNVRYLMPAKPAKSRHSMFLFSSPLVLFQKCIY